MVIIFSICATQIKFFSNVKGSWNKLTNAVLLMIAVYSSRVVNTIKLFVVGTTLEFYFVKVVCIRLNTFFSFLLGPFLIDFTAR